jgi:hypothetical protein
MKIVLAFFESETLGRDHKVTMNFFHLDGITAVSFTAAV